MQAITRLLEACFPTPAEARLVAALRQANHLLLSMVAIEADCVVGHVAGYVGYSVVTAESGEQGLGLAPIAVAESHRGQGVARLLIEHSIDACRNLPFEWLVVLGEPAMYARFGFLPASKFSLRDEYGGGPAFQALELTADALSGVSGLVRYGPEFQLCVD